jgi:hypothetical protein
MNGTTLEERIEKERENNDWLAFEVARQRAEEKRLWESRSQRQIFVPLLERSKPRGLGAVQTPWAWEPFNVSEEVRELERLKEESDKRLAALKREGEMKEQDYEKWVGDATTDELREEYSHLRKKKNAMLKERPKLKERDSFGEFPMLGDAFELGYDAVNRELTLVLTELAKRNALPSQDDEDSNQARKPEPATRGAASGPEPIVWLGTDRDFGDAVFKLHRKNLIQGKNWLDALRILAAHFVDNEGNRFNPENIRESIRTREKREGKGGLGEGLKLD